MQLGALYKLYVPSVTSSPSRDKLWSNVSLFITRCKNKYLAYKTRWLFDEYFIDAETLFVTGDYFEFI